MKFKISVVKGVEYLQIWEDDRSKCVQIGSAKAILKLKSENEEMKKKLGELVKPFSKDLGFSDD